MKGQGEIIKSFREKLGLSQEAMAGYLAVKREMVSYYETGAREVPLEVLEKLAALFGVNLDVFFSDDPREVMADLAFAFRADDLNERDLEAIACFKKVVKNYQRMLNLEKLNVKG